MLPTLKDLANCCLGVATENAFNPSGPELQEESLEKRTIAKLQVIGPFLIDKSRIAEIRCECSDLRSWKRRRGKSR
jgi:hypothetical protein